MEKKTMLFVKGNPALSAEAPTRRQVLASAVIAFGGLVLASAPAYAAAEEEISHTAESIHQETMFKTNRKRVYEALIDTKQFDKIMQISRSNAGRCLWEATPTQSAGRSAARFRSSAATSWAVKSNWCPTSGSCRRGEWSTGIQVSTRSQSSNYVEQGAGTKLVFDHTGFPKGDAETSGGRMEEPLLGATRKITGVARDVAAAEFARMLCDRIHRCEIFNARACIMRRMCFVSRRDGESFRSAF